MTDTITVPNVTELVKIIYELKMHGLPFHVDHMEDGTSTVTLFKL